jgi:hypothetical protein
MTWYGDNEQIAYPLVGNDDSQIPSNIIVDCVVHAPLALGQQLQLMSISCTPLLVSVVVAISGVAVAYFTGLKQNLQIYAPNTLVPIISNNTPTGVSGFITFGSGINQHNLRVDGLYSFVSAALISYDYAVNPVTCTASNASGVGGTGTFYGLVSLSGQNGISISKASIAIGSPSAYQTVIFFSVNDPIIYTQAWPACEKPAAGNPNVQPITSINGVIPALTTGDISLVVLNLDQTGTDPLVGVTAVGAHNLIAISDAGEPCGS